jgi:hypothetical protein
MTWTLQGGDQVKERRVLPDPVRILTTPRGSDVTSATICETKLAVSA